MKITKKHTISKRSQMEIMGLVIIVILMALAMLFVLQFIVLREPSDIKKSFTHKEMAANTVNSMLDTTTDCKDLSISQLLEECAEGGYLQCPSGNSCSYARSIINQILNNTLSQWNKRYYLTVISDDGDILSPFGEACLATEEKTTSSPCCILPTGAGPITVNLDICG